MKIIQIYQNIIRGNKKKTDNHFLSPKNLHQRDCRWRLWRSRSEICENEFCRNQNGHALPAAAAKERASKRATTLAHTSNNARSSRDGRNRKRQISVRSLCYSRATDKDHQCCDEMIIDEVILSLSFSGEI